MLPKIKRIELGKIHVNDDIITDDFLLHAKGIEPVEKKINFGIKDLERMAVYEPDAIVIGAGFRNRGKVDEDFIATARKQKIDTHVLSTPEAIEKFLDLTRKGKKVVAHIRVGE